MELAGNLVNLFAYFILLYIVFLQKKAYDQSQNFWEVRFRENEISLLNTYGSHINSLRDEIEHLRNNKPDVS